MFNDRQRFIQTLFQLGIMDFTYVSFLDRVMPMKREMIEALTKKR